MKFVDEVAIEVTAGNGGHGCISFRREKHIAKGGPDGGDGGKGGDVICRADENLGTLMDLQYRRHYKAGRGLHGSGNNRTGESGDDCIIPVPLGSIITDAVTGEELGDLITDGQQVVVARGGHGGKGNSRFKSPTQQTPRKATDGGTGEKRRLRIELRLIADVGLVGYPNAGKSTFLRAVSAAEPKVAPYPFTTLQPKLGVVRRKEFRSFTVADIPGLIEGAARGKGLGHQFLRHIRRTKVLLFLFDCQEPEVENQLPALLEELREFDPVMMAKERLIVINKIDTWEHDSHDERRREFAWADYVISAREGAGIEPVLAKLEEMLFSSEKTTTT